MIVSRTDTLKVDALAEEQGSWRVTDAVLVGFGGFTVLLTLLFRSGEYLEQSGLLVLFSKFQAREVTTLVSLLGTTLILGPVVLFIVRKRQLGGWWKSIEWNAGRHSWGSAASGAILAVAWTLGLGLIRGTAGTFHDRALALGVILYVLTDVIVSPALEEMYFRGILFLALAKKLGPAISIVIVTVIFGVAHPGHWLDVLPVAFATGAARLRTNSVCSCFALHASYNCFLILCQLLITLIT